MSKTFYKIFRLTEKKQSDNGFFLLYCLKNSNYAKDYNYKFIIFNIIIVIIMLIKINIVIN